MIIDTLAFIFRDHTEFFSDKLLVGETAHEEIIRWAVLIDGLRGFEVSPEGAEAFKEERAWVMAEDWEWPFSFLNLCRNFHVDAESLRHYLLSSKS